MNARTPSRAFATAIGAASLAALAACQTPSTDSELPKLAPTDDPGVYGARIVQHPRFATLLARVDSKLDAVAAAVASQPVAQTLTDLATFENCKLTMDYAPCTNRLSQLGISQPSVHTDLGDVRLIAADVGLAQASSGVAAAAFHEAVFAKNGAAEGSTLVPIVAGRTFSDAPGWVCDAACKETMGNMLGMSEGDYLFNLYARSSTSARTTGATPDDDGDTGQAIVIITTVISVATLLEKWIWNSGEDDKECEHDSDCPSDEFCHKLGENDCRPANEQGHLCTRDAECLSDCCKIYWGIPQCRPADKCD